MRKHVIAPLLSAGAALALVVGFWQERCRGRSPGCATTRSWRNCWVRGQVSAVNSDGMQRQAREFRHQAAGKPPHRVTIAAVRRRAVRRPAMEAVVGTAVLAAVISAAVPASGGVLGAASARATQGPAKRTPTAFVVNSVSNALTPVNTATNTAGKPIKVAEVPNAIAITPDGRTAYVVSNPGFGGKGSNAVMPISTATNTPGRPIPVGNGAFGIAITPDGKTAYVADSGYDRGHTVTPISTATNTAGKLIQVGKGPGPIAITP
jgi:hypothetical protein